MLKKFSVNNFHYLIAQCPEIQSPEDGMVTTTSRRLSGDNATYTCNSGYLLVDINLDPGNDVRTCQTDGTWSGLEPQCVGMLIMLIACRQAQTYASYFQLSVHCCSPQLMVW